MLLLLNFTWSSRLLSVVCVLASLLFYRHCRQSINQSIGNFHIDQSGSQ